MIDHLRDKVRDIVESHFIEDPTKPHDHWEKGIQAIDDVMVEYQRSFGGCTICWGKGYVHMQPEQIETCTCLRGTQLHYLFDLIVQKKVKKEKRHD